MAKNNDTNKDLNKDDQSISNSREQSGNSQKGFADMDTERSRETSSRGGLGSHRYSRYEDNDSDNRNRQSHDYDEDRRR